MASNNKKLFTVVVGNSGVGKSTLLNSICSQKYFSSGTSFGTGKTSQLQLLEYPPKSGYFWGDTPGLADVAKRKQAAEEIEKAMKQNGYYRIIFVLTLESGRLKPEDCASLEVISESLPHYIPYAIVINKVSSHVMELLTLKEGAAEHNKKVKEKTQQIFRDLFRNVRPTPFVRLLPLDPKIFDEQNQISIEISRYLKPLLAVLPSVNLQPENVRSIDSRLYQEFVEKVEQETKKLENDKKKQEELYKQRMDELNQQLQDKGSEYEQVLKNNQLLIASGVKVTYSKNIETEQKISSLQKQINLMQIQMKGLETENQKKANPENIRCTQEMLFRNFLSAIVNSNLLTKSIHKRDPSEIHIGLLGVIGSGKTTMINTLYHLGLPVGTCATSTISLIYSNPFQNRFVWDSPGLRTHTSYSNVDTLNFYFSLDICLVLYSNSLEDPQVRQLIRVINAINPNSLVLVRSKCDENDISWFGHQLDIQNEIERDKKDLKNILARQDVPIYAISSKEPKKFDFQKIAKEIFSL